MTWLTILYAQPPMLMPIDPEQTLTSISLPDSLSAISSWILSYLRTHRYINQVEGIDYVFELIADSDRAQMTAHGKGIKVGDYIILPGGRYRVESISYYASPSTLWMAMLTKVSE